MSSSSTGNWVTTSAMPVFSIRFSARKSSRPTGVLDEVAASIRMKVADDAKLRAQVADEEAEQIADAAPAIRERIRARRKADPVRQRRLGYRC